jgi:hypothetical protein
MSRETDAKRCALGFRVKSGWATAVLLAGSAQRPHVVVGHRIVELSDQAVPESRQPYHAGMGKLETDEHIIRSRTATAEKVARQSISRLLMEFRGQVYQLRGAGLVVGSLVEPGTVTNPHIRAHALEGKFFRRLLIDALDEHGMPCPVVVVERELYSQATRVLNETEDDLRRVLMDLGRSIGGRWRAPEKQAALVAWMTLV